MEKTIEIYLDDLSALCSIERSVLDSYLKDLLNAREFLDQINHNIRDVNEFQGKQFSDVSEMRVFRVLLYLLTRIKRPESFVETGVHNGMSSAFILLAMEHNDKGHLYSIDLPPTEDRILDQGTNRLPTGKEPGWIIPESLRIRHTIYLEAAQVRLPSLLADLGAVKVFLHDSDHEYTHIMFEIGLVWSYLKNEGLIIVDNIEQNDAFSDFVRATGSPHKIISSFLGAARTWQHGVLSRSDG